MKPDDLNYRHLLYFWAVAKEGSITRAGERLGLSVQAISTQLSQLERQLGQALLAPQGRSLVLTETGRRVLAYADQIWMELPVARFFRSSPVMELLDFLERLAPFSTPDLILRDEKPRFVKPAKVATS